MNERENFIKILTEKGGAKNKDTAHFRKREVYVCKLHRQTSFLCRKNVIENRKKI